MHHFLEADYRIGPLDDVEETLNKGIDKLLERNKEYLWFDGLWISEYSEVLLGSLFVACQAYCVGCTMDINQLRKDYGLKPLKKIDAYRMHHYKRNRFSIIELINASANCFKHRDEWGETWPENLTVQTLAAYNITPKTQFPLNEAQEIISTDFNYKSLSELLVEWRKLVIRNSKVESGNVYAN